MRVTVMGAGVFGASAASKLAERGHEVILRDQGPVPHPLAASTDISKIVRLDYGADDFYTALMERALPAWRELNRRWPRPLFHETGFVVLSSVPLAAGSFEHDSLTVLEARGHEVERLDTEALARRFPRFGDGFVDGYFNPRGGWAESGEVSRALVQDAERAGVRFESVRTTVEEAQADCDCVVVAAGAWTPHLLPELQPLMRVVGQPVLHFQPTDVAAFSPPAHVPWAADIARTGWYGFSANAAGVVKVANHGPGIEVDPAGPRAVPDDSEAKFRAFFERALPELATAPKVGERLCLYCDTFDGDFLIARHPERPSVVVATGGSGHGFKFAPILGDLVADAVEDRSDPSHAARFGFRKPVDPGFEDARFSG